MATINMAFNTVDKTLKCDMDGMEMVPHSVSMYGYKDSEGKMKYEVSIGMMQDNKDYRVYTSIVANELDSLKPQKSQASEDVAADIRNYLKSLKS